MDNIADEALQSIAQQIKSSQTAILDIELNQIDQKLYIYSPRPTGPGKGGFENFASLEKRDNTDFLVIEDNEFYPLDQFPNLSGTKVQADHIISSRGEYLEKVELVTKEDRTIVFRAAVDGIRNQLKAIGASDQLIARIKSIDQAQVLTDDILSKRELLDFFEGRVNGVGAWEKTDDLVEAGHDAYKQFKNDPDFLKKFDDVIKDADLNKHIFMGDPVIVDGNIRGISGVHSNINLVLASQASGIQGNIKIQPNTKVDLGSGYYEAKVQVYGKKGDGQGGFVDGWVKGKKSTFFPDSWNEIRIQAEITRGIKNKTPDPSFPVSTGKKAYQATMSDGTKLQMIFDGEVLDSAFPNLR